MRILHISSLWPPVVLGGAELYAARLAREQASMGHTVGALTFGVPGDYVIEDLPAWPYRLDHFDEQPLWRRGTFHLLDLYNPLAAARLRRAIGRFAPDVIHSHVVAGLSTAAVTAGAGSAARVHHLHGYWLMCRRTTMRRPNGEVCTDLSCRVVSASRSVLMRAHPPELFLAPSQSVIDAHAHLPWTEGRMRHLPHPLDQPAADHAVAVVTPGGKATFGYLGQLSEPKGIRTLLAAFASVVDDGHRLLVGGQGPMADALGRAGPSVEVLGWLDDSEKDRFFSRIHCLIVPSNYPETGPLVVLEARARGVPVIGSRLGGIPENVGPLCRSLLFTPGDAADLSDSIRRFVADPERFAASPDALAAEPTMSWPLHSAAVVAYYEEAICRRQVASGQRKE